MKRHFKAKVATAVLGVALATALTPALAMADTTGLPNEDVYTETNVSAEELSPALPSAASTSTDGTSAQTGNSDASARPSDESVTGGVTPKTPGQSTSAPDAPADDPTTSAASPVSDATEPETPAPSDSMNDGANEPDGATSPNKAAQAGDVIDGVITTQDGSGTCGDGVSWTLEGKFLWIMPQEGVGTGTMTDYSEGTAPWSSFASGITTLCLDDGITHIGNYAFANFTALQYVVIPGTVITIGDYAFANCTNLQSITFCNASSISSYDSKLEQIGSHAFEGADIISIDFSDTVSNIQDYAFFNCKSLQTINFGGRASGLSSIGAYAFGVDMDSDMSPYKRVCFAGTQTQWDQLSIGEGNSKLDPASGFFNCYYGDNLKMYVTFNANGGTFSNGATVWTISVNDDGSLFEYACGEPTNGDRTFAGWYIERMGGAMANEVSTFTYNITLYAQWKELQNKYWINFYKDSSSSDSLHGIQTLPNGAVIELPRDTPTHDQGYEFAGWVDEAGRDVVSGTIFTQDTKVYAKWNAVDPTPITHTVTFDAGNGVFSNGYSTMNITADANGALASAVETPSLNGFTFAGWFDAATGGNPVNVSDPFLADATVYAHWTENQATPPVPGAPFIITFDAYTGQFADQSVTTTLQTDSSGVLQSLPAAPTKSGHSFVGWYTAQNGAGNHVEEGYQLNSSAQVYALWKQDYTAPIEYDISFYLNDGVNTGVYSTIATTTSGGYHVLSSLPVQPTRDGYDFAGWFTETSGGKKIELLRSEFTENTSVYAQWTSQQVPVTGYTVTFDANGGTLTGDATMTTDANGNLGSLPTAPSWEGYTFTGWFDAAIGGNEITTGTSFTANTTVYAQWTANGDTPTPGASYTITFDANGGTLAEGVVNTRTTGTDGKLAGVVSAPVMDGYTFVGWFTATNGGEQVTTSYVFTADATVYAQWTQNTTPVDPDDPNDPDNPDDPNVPDNPDDPDQPIKPVYNVIDGANGQWTAESGAALEVRADGEFANFDHVKVDGVRVDEMHYDAREGSTIITLKPSFLSTLSDGVHSLTFAYKDGGEANTNFTVAAKPAVYVPGDADATPTQVDATVAADGASGVDVPKTGDNALVILYVCMMVAAIAGLYAVRVARRVRQ